MVGAHDILEDKGILESGLKRRGDAEVVYAPPDVLGPRMKPICPPGVLAWLLVEFAEGIYEAAFNIPVESAPLLDGEAGIALIGLRVLEVNRLMSHIEVAAEYHGLFLFEFF